MALPFHSTGNWVYESKSFGITSPSVSLVRRRPHAGNDDDTAHVPIQSHTSMFHSSLLCDNRDEINQGKLTAASSGIQRKPVALSDIMFMRGNTRRPEPSLKITNAARDAGVGVGIDNDAEMQVALYDMNPGREREREREREYIGALADIDVGAQIAGTSANVNANTGTNARFITPAPGGPPNVKPPSTFGLVLNLVFMWITYFFMTLLNTILACQLPLVLLAIWAFLYITRFYFVDILDTTSAAYEVLALVLNWIIDRLNDVWELFQPFVPVYNLVIYMFMTIIDSIFASISIEMLVDLLTQMADAALQLVPVLVDILRTLMPVILSIVPALIQVVIKLFVENIQILVDLIQLIAKLVLALVPTFVQLIPILASLITTVFESFADVFVQIMGILLDIIATALPYVLQLVDIFVAIITEVAANTTPGMDFFAFIGLFLAASLGFLADIIAVFVNLIVELVTNNLPIIVDFVVQIVTEVVKLIPPIVTTLIQVVVSSFGTIVDLVKALIDAIISLVPTLIKVFDNLMASGVITDLISALTSMFLVPRSPAMLQNIATVVANFVTSNIGLLEQAFITIFEAITSLLPMVGVLLAKIIASGILGTLISVVVEVIADFLPLLAGILTSILNSVTESGIIETLLKAIIDMFVQLAIPILIILLTKIPFTALVKLLVSIIIAVTKLIPVLIQLLLNMIIGPTGFAVIVGLVTGITELITFFFTDPSISGLIPTVLEGILNGFLSLFTGPNGVKISLKWLKFIFDLFFGIVARFFYLLAQLATGGEEGSVNENNILKLIEPVLSFFQVLFTAVSQFGQLLAQVEFLTDAFGWMFSIFDYLLALADVIGQLVDLLS